MNKELTPLETLEKLRQTMQRLCRECWENTRYSLEYSHQLDSIETALKRLALFDDENVVAYLSRNDEKKLKALEFIEENLKHGYVFIGYNEDHEPLFQFANTELYMEIKKNLSY